MDVGDTERAAVISSLATAVAVFFFVSTANGILILLLLPPGGLRDIAGAASLFLSGGVGLFTFWWRYHQGRPPRE